MAAATSSMRGEDGVFERAEDAISEAAVAYLSREAILADREHFIQAIRDMTLEHKHYLSQMIWEETVLGRAADKVAKLELIATKTPGTEQLRPEAVSIPHFLVSAMVIVPKGAAPCSCEQEYEIDHKSLKSFKQLKTAEEILAYMDGYARQDRQGKGGFR